MIHDNDFEYFEKMAHWSFDEYGIHEEMPMLWFCAASASESKEHW